jgi:hypothetical protein
LLSNLVVAGGFALIFLLLSWLRHRTPTAGMAIKSFKIRLLVYGFVFVLGEGYLIVIFADLKWPKILLFLAIASWGVLLGSGVWYRHQRRAGDSDIAQK